MNIKIIISLFLFITTHNNFCMIIKKNQKKHTTHIHKIQQNYQQKEVDEYLKPFMLRSLLENSKRFQKQKTSIKYAIINQCKENHDTSPIIGLIQLPIEDQFKIISYFFENRCLLAAEDFICKPLEIALKEYNALPENTLTLLSSKHNLTPSMIFRLTDEEQRILTKIYTNDIIASTELNSLIQKLPKDILKKILAQNPNITMLENESKLLVFLTTPYYGMTKEYPLAGHITLSLAGIGYIPLYDYIIGPVLFYDHIKCFNPIGFGKIEAIYLLGHSTLYACFNLFSFSNYYKTATTSTITKPLKSLL